MPKVKGKVLVMSSEDMRRILDQLGPKYTEKVVLDALKKKIIKLAPHKYSGWEWKY